jgi:hypothetical protein
MFFSLYYIIGWITMSKKKENSWVYAFQKMNIIAEHYFSSYIFRYFSLPQSKSHKKT